MADPLDQFLASKHVSVGKPDPKTGEKPTYEIDPREFEKIGKLHAFPLGVEENERGADELIDVLVNVPMGPEGPGAILYTREVIKDLIAENSGRNIGKLTWRELFSTPVPNKDSKPFGDYVNEYLEQNPNQRSTIEAAVLGHNPYGTNIFEYGPMGPFKFKEGRGPGKLVPKVRDDLPGENRSSLAPDSEYAALEPKAPPHFLPPAAGKNSRNVG